MSIGIGDTVADLATGTQIARIIDKAKDDVKRIIEEYQVCAGYQKRTCSSQQADGQPDSQWIAALSKQQQRSDHGM